MTPLNQQLLKEQESKTITAKTLPSSTSSPMTGLSASSRAGIGACSGSVVCSGTVVCTASGTAYGACDGAGASAGTAGSAANSVFVLIRALGWSAGRAMRLWDLCANGRLMTGFMLTVLLAVTGSSAQAAPVISDVISISQTVQFLLGELLLLHQRLIFYANNFMVYIFTMAITLEGIKLILRHRTLNTFVLSFVRIILVFGIIKVLILSSDLIAPDLVATALRLGGDNAIVSGDISTVIGEIFALIEDYARSIISTNVIFFFIFVSIIYVCILVLVVYYILLFLNVYLSCSFGMFTITFAAFKTTRPIAWSYMLHLLGLMVRIAGMSAMICMSLEVITTLMIKMRYAALMGQIISVQDAGLVCLLVVLTTAACIYAPGRLASMIKNAPLNIYR